MEIKVILRELATEDPEGFRENGGSDAKRRCPSEGASAPIEEMPKAFGMTCVLEALHRRGDISQTLYGLLDANATAVGIRAPRYALDNVLDLCRDDSKAYGGPPASESP